MLRIAYVDLVCYCCGGGDIRRMLSGTFVLLLIGLLGAVAAGVATLG